MTIHQMKSIWDVLANIHNSGGLSRDPESGGPMRNMYTYRKVK